MGRTFNESTRFYGEQNFVWPNYEQSHFFVVVVVVVQRSRQFVLVVSAVVVVGRAAGKSNYGS